MADANVRLCYIAGAPIHGFLNSEGGRPEAKMTEARTPGWTQKVRSGTKTAPDLLLKFERDDVVKKYFDDWERQAQYKTTRRNVVLYITDSTGRYENWTDRVTYYGCEILHHDVGGEDYDTAERAEKIIYVQLAVKKVNEESRGAAAI